MLNKTYETHYDIHSENLTKVEVSNPVSILALIATMKLSKSWAKGELNAIVLLNSPNLKIVLTMVHKDTEILSFQGGHSTTFQVIEGGLNFLNHNGSAFIDKGYSLKQYDKLNYSLSNTEETIFLLTTDNRIN